MELSRRDFLKASGLASIGAALASLGIDMPKVKAAAKEFKLKGAKEFTSICHFCACGCGVVGSVKDGKLINLEGDPDSPINRGALCSKGLGYGQVPNSKERGTKPLYRAPGSDHWEEISWDEAIDKAAHAFKRARDNNWRATENIDGREVRTNRTDAIGFIGGSQVNNEECYQLIKMTRGLGAVYTDNQTRVCHATTPPAMGAAFGRGAMTGSWMNIKDAKLIWVEGSNLAECHPMGLKNVMKAKENGAKIVHVDMRFTRTSKIADKFLQIRPGTDIVFLGAIINYIIQNKKFDEDYLRRNTNAFCLLRPDFGFQDGLFSGYNEATRSYDMTTWGYDLGPDTKPQKASDIFAPHTVMSVMKEHYSRYTFEMAENITGIPAAEIKAAAELFSSVRPAIFMYALGMTQHTVGVENIRCFTILQLLMGNVGRAGTGIDAMRGQPNVQASTDFAIEFNCLPGYLDYPTEKTDTFKKWEEKSGTFRSKFLRNTLLAWYGEHATAENDYGMKFLPIRNSHHNDSIYGLFDEANLGTVKCIYVTGQNPAVTNANLTLVQNGLKKIDSLICQDIFINETAEFWNKPGENPKDIQTEVIYLPACSYLERRGSITNSMRLVQWRQEGPAPLGDSKPDYWICNQLWRRIVELYKDSTDPKDDPIKFMTWNYSDDHTVEDILKEVNGYDLTTGKLLNGIREIKADGTTNSGMWIYAGVYGGGQSLPQRREQDDEGDRGIYPHYAWCWPDNIHMLYNRASCDEKGQPIDPDKKLVWWDAAKGEWDGYDVPDVGNRKAGPDTPDGQKPFRMNGEGIGRLFAANYTDKNPDGTSRDHSSTPVDGPLPEFYEPVESPTQNALHSNKDAQYNPCCIYPRVPELQPKVGTPDEFPYVLTSSGIAEHWCSGTVTRNIPWLNELVKEPFVEMSEPLAKQLGVKGGDKVKVRSARGEVQVKAMVTKRINPLKINGKETHMVWMPYSWGFKGLSKGPSTNYLTIDALDPNVQEQEFKACLVDIKKA